MRFGASALLHWSYCNSMFGIFLQELWRLRPSLFRKLAQRQCLLCNRRFGRPCLYHLQRSRRPELKSLPFTGTFSNVTLYFKKQITFRMHLPSETSSVLLNVVWRWKRSWWMWVILVMWHHFQEHTWYMLQGVPFGPFERRRCYRQAVPKRRRENTNWCYARL